MEPRDEQTGLMEPSNQHCTRGQGHGDARGAIAVREASRAGKVDSR